MSLRILSVLSRVDDEKKKKKRNELKSVHVYKKLPQKMSESQPTAVSQGCEHHNSKVLPQKIVKHYTYVVVQNANEYTVTQNIKNCLFYLNQNKTKVKSKGI